MSITEQINHAISAHGMWKARLRQAAETGTSEWGPDSVRADDQCDFGKWLLTLKPPDSNSERLASIKRMHSEFHREAARVLTLVLSGKKAEAEAAIAGGSLFAQTGADLTLALVNWRDSLWGR